MTINMLFVLIIIGGWAFGKGAGAIKLPGVLGMILWGVLLAGFFKDSFPPIMWDIAPFLKSLALITILLRAGLGIRKEALNKVGGAAVRMALIPCLLEGAAVTIVCHYLFSFSWAEAGMLGFILAAVSPAVVVPAMLRLKEEGFGNKNETPTLILAGASLDNVIAITVFTVFLNMSRGTSVHYWQTLASVPYAVSSGLVIGLFGGWLLAWFLKKHDQAIRATEKTIVVLGTAVVLVQVGDSFHIAALLGIMTMGFILLERAEGVAHELAEKLNKIWVLAEIILFVLIGMAVDVPTAVRAGGLGLFIVSFGLVFRSLGVFGALLRTPLSLNERFFCMIAYVPKATVQAALGAAPLLAGAPHGEIILSIAVLSICFTAPLGPAVIRYSAPRLLEGQHRIKGGRYTAV